MMQPYIHIIHFVYETLIFLYFSRSIKAVEGAGNRRRLASALFLLLPLVLYTDALIVEHVLLRLALRWGCYLCFFLLNRKGTGALCGYYALLCLTVFTANTNIFQTSMLYPISRGLVPFTGNTLLDALANSTIEYLFCFALFFLLTHLVDLNHIADLNYRRFAVALAVLACEIYVKASLHAITESGQGMIQELSLYTIFLSLVMVALLIIYENYLYTRRLQEIAHLQEISTRYQADAYRRQIDHENDTHRLYHDMKNHLLAIRGLCQEDESRVQGYIDTLIGSFMEIASPVIETGNVLLDGLIAQKGDTAKAAHIDMSVIIDARPISYLSDADLCIIFGNALDNAVEGCLNLPSEGDRFIELKGGPVNNQYFLTITNSYNGNVLVAANQFLTMKPDKAMHGFGLRGIRTAVEKYRGTLCIDTTEQRFKLTIMLPLTGQDEP